MKELYEKYAGKRAIIFLGGLTIEVLVEDVKISYGKERFLVTPIKGGGKIWVETITLTAEDKRHD